MLRVPTNEETKIAGYDLENTDDIFEYLKFVETFDDKSIREALLSFVAGLAIAAGVFYTGYQVSRLRDPAIRIADSLEGINDKLGKVLTVVNNFQPIIERVLEKIELLVEELRGIVNEIVIGEHLAKLTNQLDFITEYMKNERNLKYAVKSGSLEDRLVQLGESINVINSLGGYTGILFCGPAMALWAQAYCAQEKALYEIALEENKTPEPMREVYNHNVHRRHFVHFKNFFDNTEKYGSLALENRRHSLYIREGGYYERINGASSTTAETIQLKEVPKPQNPNIPTPSHTLYYAQWERDQVEEGQSEGLKVRLTWYSRHWVINKPPQQGYTAHDIQLSPDQDSHRRILDGLRLYTNHTESTEFTILLSEQAAKNKTKIMDNMTPPPPPPGKRNRSEQETLSSLALEYAGLHRPSSKQARKTEHSERGEPSHTGTHPIHKKSK